MAAVWLLVLLAACALLAAPVLALVSFIRLRRLEDRPDPARLFERVAALEARIAELEGRSPGAIQDSATTAAPAAASPADPGAVAAWSAPRARVEPALPSDVPPARTVQARPAASGIDFEARVAGRWLNRVGLVAVVVGVAFFLKYAIDNDWVGPTGQIMVGLVLGAGLVALSVRLHRQGHAYFADGLTGLGGAVLYLSLWAAGNYYRLLPAGVSFAAMVAVTAALLAVAAGRRSQRVALLGLIGGFATPALLSTGADRQVVLFLYVAALNLSVQPLARAYDWRWLELPALAGTQLYFWLWYDRFYTPDRLATSALFAVIFFAEFLHLSALRARALGRLLRPQVALLFANAGLFLLALHAMLWPDHRWALTLVALAMSGVYLALGRAARPAGEPRVSQEPPAALLFAGMALTLVTLAVPIALDGRWITIAWAVEAAVLIWSGFQAGVVWLRGTGLALFAVVGWRLLALQMPADRFLLNARFFLFAAVIAAAGAALWSAARARSRLLPGERKAFLALGIAVNVLALVAMTLEIYEYFDPSAGYAAPRDAYRAAGLTTSIVWTLYASALMYAGTRRRQAGLRWLGLALFGVTTGKVFLIDLAELSGIYRVVSSIVLGAVLLVISFFYQRRMAASRRDLL